MNPNNYPFEPPINTPRAFIEYIQNSTFDPTSVQPWERETLSSYLNQPKDFTTGHAMPCDKPLTRPDINRR